MNVYYMNGTRESGVDPTCYSRSACTREGDNMLRYSLVIHVLRYSPITVYAQILSFYTSAHVLSHYNHAKVLSV